VPCHLFVLISFDMGLDLEKTTLALIATVQEMRQSALYLRYIG